MIDSNIFLIGGVVYFIYTYICFLRGFMLINKRVGYFLANPLKIEKIYKSQNPKSFWTYFIINICVAVVLISYSFIFEF